MPRQRHRSLFDHASELILELNFGEGGEDSKLFVSQLLAAYLKYCSKLNLKTETLDVSHGHVELKIEGKDVGKAFKNEPGSHCVQRYPANDRGGRRHTSVVSVGVLPLPPEKSYKPLPENELRTITQRKGGPGGQHRNKTDSAVRMTHIPTSIEVFIDGRDQHQNKKTALRILTARVNDEMNRQKTDDYQKLKKNLVGARGRGTKRRTYNFIDSWVKDHVTGKKTHKPESIMNGNFELLS